LTSASYRFRARPFDLVSTPSACEHCEAGCAQRTDHRRGKVTRRLAGNDPAVNEEWNCDKGRWAFRYETAPDRITHPLVRNEDGDLEPASWPAALAAAAAGLAAARGRAGVLVGGRLTVEDAYAYAKFARVALGTNDVDFRARPHSAEEAEFLAARVAGTGIGVTYAELERAPAVVLVALEPEEEVPIVFLRLRKAVRKEQQRVLAIAPFATRGYDKLGATLIPTAPGREVEALDRLAADTAVDPPLVPADAVVLVGERLAETPGGLSAAVRLAEAKSARLAWVPRRAGDRGAVEAGALPNLLPGGRPVADAAARVDVQTVWSVESLPADPGRDGQAMLAAAAAGELAALLVGAVDPDDLPDPAAAREALDKVPFLVSLEIRSSAVTERADVVLPVASVTEKPAGTFINWEGRERPFSQVFNSNLMTDGSALSVLANELDVDLGLPTPAAARAELLELSGWEGTRVPDPTHAGVVAPATGPGEVVLATWHQLLDRGRLQDDEPYLAGTARATVARLSPTTAASVGVLAGDPVTVSTEHGAITAPVEITDMVDGVIWLPTNSTGSAVRRELSASSGSIVRIAAASGAADPGSAQDRAAQDRAAQGRGNGDET
jgi:NADH-quinone oxidoreductase subunit G